MRQVVCGHALEHDGRGDPRFDQRGVERHQVLGGSDDVLGVGSRGARERNVVSRRHVIDAFPHGVHLACAFEPERAGQVAGVTARTLVDVYKVDAGGRELYARLTGARFWGLHVLVAKDLGSAELGYPDSLHASLPPAMNSNCTPVIVAAFRLQSAAFGLVARSGFASLVEA